MRYRFKFAVLLAWFASGTGLIALSSAGAQSPNQNVAGIEIQARGVVHEAFALPVDPNIPQPGPIVPQQPPPPIQEVPAEMQPQGDNVQWFSGYWAWEADINNFVWITGGYRNVPPGQRYMAGYWEQTPEGFRWVNGFWVPETMQELPYVPEPPAPLEIAPVLPPPGDNYFYSPGVWAYRQSRYVWQPGYYAPCRPGLIWVPPHYVWTPSGYLCLPGRWDYPLDQCGLMFAPVVFNQPLWRNPGWTWCPQYAVGFSALFDSLFIDVRFGNYRYGDYYGRNYVDRGIHPWHTHGARLFDPQFNYYSWNNRGNPNWQTGLSQRYNDRVGGRMTLPPRTLAQQNLVAQQNSTTNVRMVQPVTQFNDKGVKLAKVTQQGLSQQQLAIQRQLDASNARLNSETTNAKGKGGAGNAALRIGDFAKGNFDAGTKGAGKSFDPKFTFPDKKGNLDVISPKTLPTLPPSKKGAANFVPPAKGGTDLPPSGKKGGADTILPKTLQNVKPPDPPKSLSTIPPGPAKTLQSTKLPEFSKLPPLNTQKQVVKQVIPPTTAKQKSAVQSGPPPTVTKQLPPPTLQKQQVVQQAKSPPPTIQKQVTPPPAARSGPGGAGKNVSSSTFKAPTTVKTQSSPAARGSPPPASRKVQAGTSSRPPMSSGSGNNRSGGGAKAGKKGGSF